jgi:hypothetical protein
MGVTDDDNVRPTFGIEIAALNNPDTVSLSPASLAACRWCRSFIETDES